MAADLVVVFHAAFVLFVVFGALLVLKWPVLVWAHVPAALWGASIEWYGWVCPLTPLENRLRVAGGGKGYAGGFIEHYLEPLLYPSGLSHKTQLMLGAAVIVSNAVVYGLLILRTLRK